MGCFTDFFIDTCFLISNLRENFWKLPFSCACGYSSYSIVILEKQLVQSYWGKFFFIKNIAAMLVTNSLVLLLYFGHTHIVDITFTRPSYAMRTSEKRSYRTFQIKPINPRFLAGLQVHFCGSKLVISC